MRYAMLIHSKQGGARKLNHSLNGRRRKEARNRTLLRLNLPGGAWTGSSMAHKDKEPNALKNLARLTALLMRPKSPRKSEKKQRSDLGCQTLWPQGVKEGDLMAVG